MRQLPDERVGAPQALVAGSPRVPGVVRGDAVAVARSYAVQAVQNAAVALKYARDRPHLHAHQVAAIDRALQATGDATDALKKKEA